MTVSEVLRVAFRKGFERLGRFYGIYEAFVVENSDPSKMGRLRLTVPIIHGAHRGAQLVWAQAITQWTGKGYGVFILPKVGDKVMVQFKNGNPRYPMWSHGFRVIGDIPERYLNDYTYGIKTPNGIEVYIDDQAKKVVIHNPEGVTQFNDGEQGGLVNISYLIAKLNALENQQNDILDKLKNHTHTGNSSAPTSPPITPVDLAIMQSLEISDPDELEDKKVIH